MEKKEKGSRRKGHRNISSRREEICVMGELREARLTSLPT